MKRKWSEQERRAIQKKSATYREKEARRIADSAVRIAAMTDPMSNDERDEMWNREYEFALDRLSGKRL